MADPSEISIMEAMLATIAADRALHAAAGESTVADDRNSADFSFSLSLLRAGGVADSAATVAAKLADGLAAAAAAADNGVPTSFAERVFRVSDSVFLGSEYGAQDGALLRGLGITRVVNCVFSTATGKKRMGNFYAHEPAFEYLRLQLGDSPDEAPRVHRAAVDAAVPAIKKWVAEGHRVLVHCSAGMSRSPSIVMAYLMAAEGLSLRAAHDRVRAARGRDLDVRGVYYTSLYRLENPAANAAVPSGPPPSLDFTAAVVHDVAMFGISAAEVAAALAANGYDAHKVFTAKMGE